MYDCRKFWGRTTSPYVRALSAAVVFLSFCSPVLFAQDATDPPATEDAPTTTDVLPETVNAPIVEEPEVQESQVGEEALRGALAIMDGADPDSVSDGGMDSEMLGEGASMMRNAILQMFGGLSVVLALILFVYWGFRRFGKGIPALAGRQMGQVIGQLHLTRDATLFYVRTGGRVLLISLSSGEVRTVAEFDESAFSGDLGASVRHKGFAPERFTDELKEQSSIFAGGEKSDLTDDDMAALRSDIHRLQEYLQEEARDSKD